MMNISNYETYVYLSFRGLILRVISMSEFVPVLECLCNNRRCRNGVLIAVELRFNEVLRD